MASRREQAPSRKMRSMILVICEGETEEQYLNLLRRWFKSPIRIVVRKEGARINQSLVNKLTDGLKIFPTDNVRTFLMYDMDVPSVTKKLIECKSELLLSNPCFEIWLLLHVKEHKSLISSDSVVRELRKSSSVWANYSKSYFSDTQQVFLKNNTQMAVERAKKLSEHQNPSTEIYKLIEVLKQ